MVGDPHVPVDDFDEHVATMKAFHQRYMSSSKVNAFGRMLYVSLM